MVHYGLRHPIKYARLVVRQASSARALGADARGQRYFVQLALEGVPYQKPKHRIGSETVGLDLGPSTIAIVPRTGEARLEVRLGATGPRGSDDPAVAAADGAPTPRQQPGELR